MQAEASPEGCAFKGGSNHRTAFVLLQFHTPRICTCKYTRPRSRESCKRISKYTRSEITRQPWTVLIDGETFKALSLRIEWPKSTYSLSNIWPRLSDQSNPTNFTHYPSSTGSWYKRQETGVGVTGHSFS